MGAGRRSLSTLNTGLRDPGAILQPSGLKAGPRRNGQTIVPAHLPHLAPSSRGGAWPVSRLPLTTMPRRGIWLSKETRRPQSSCPKKEPQQALSINVIQFINFQRYRRREGVSLSGGQHRPLLPFPKYKTCLLPAAIRLPFLPSRPFPPRNKSLQGNA